MENKNIIQKTFESIFGESYFAKIPEESEIREKAYSLWEKAGRPESDGVEFWTQAEKELAAS
jgi:hypothetical protein